jgi:beta-lactamase regulating signal transducer with metallopeptidase domain
MSVSGMIETLARASLQGALFVAAVWIVCRLFPRLPAALRCGLWWAACLKLLLGLVALPAVRLPVLPVAQAPVAETRPLYIRNGEAPLRALTPGPSPNPGEGKETDLWRMGELALAGLWLSGLLVLAGKAVRQFRWTRRIVRSAEPVREGWVRSAFAEICALLGLRRAPDLRRSADVRTPQVTGLAQPVVLIPLSGLERLTPAEISMTLCHELVHLRRKDLWLGWVPALAHRIFFFHPLAALAVREYAIAREAACDAEVLRILGTAPQAYGRLLLRWGVAPRETGLAAAGASPSLQNLKRRLQMLQQTSESKRRLSGWWWIAGAVALAGLVPLQIVAQPRTPKAPEAAQAPQAPQAPEADTPEATPTPEAEMAEAPEPPEAGDGDVPVVAPVTPLPPRAPHAARAPHAPPALAPLPPLPPVGATPRPGAAPLPVAKLAYAPPPPPVPPAAPPAPPRLPAPPRHSGYSYRHGDGGGDDYVLLYGDDGSATMSGSMDELKKVKRLQGDSKAGILWFRHGGKEYVVRDAALLKQAGELFKAQGELGARQGSLGARQGELGGRQGALGAKQGALGAEQGALAADRARRGNGGDSADDRDLEKRERELDAKMEDLGRQQEELGRQQEALGKQQEDLGRQQEELSRKAEKELRTLIDRALQSGQAQEVR